MGPQTVKGWYSVLAGTAALLCISQLFGILKPDEVQTYLLFILIALLPMLAPPGNLTAPVGASAEAEDSE